MADYTSVVTGLESIESFIKAVVPSAKVKKQTLPLDQVPGLFVIRLQNDSRSWDNSYMTAIRREFQIIYFGQDAPDVLTTMDSVSTAFYQSISIPVINSDRRYLNVDSFSFSAPFETEQEDIYASIGVLSATVRQARTQPEYEKIQRVYMRYQLRIQGG